MIRILRAADASQFFDSITDVRQKSAVIAIHNTWLDQASPLRALESQGKNSTVDLLLLYQAVAATFEECMWDCEEATMQNLMELFEKKLQQLAAESENRLATDEYLRLFHLCVEPSGVVQNILTGAIAKDSAKLSDPDMW